jgi:hydrogenase maturation protein HypF
VTRRVKVQLDGVVQGVGFRPYVYRLATSLGLTGWVVNDVRGVCIETEGPAPGLETFLRRLPAEIPPHADIHHMSTGWLEPAGYARFEIRRSDAAGDRETLVLPDLATCPDCVTELFDPGDRRHGYPFINCTQCGPRFSIVRDLPYDRPRTTMAGFTMCARCQAEYADPYDRRFHAQPDACPECGPSLSLWSGTGEVLERREAAMHGAVEALSGGAIVAVKGLGGFHLMADAADGAALARLRARKHRPDKPLALMVRDLAQARAICHVDDAAAGALSGSEAPIVLLPRRADPETAVANEVAAGSPWLGVMLPATPLHHMMMRRMGRPVVATSGNLSDEPICTREGEAPRRLGSVADLFLVHDRPIERHVDDSIVWVVHGEPAVLRRARGYAPLPVAALPRLPDLLGVGAHLKSAIALSRGGRLFMGQHIGDLESPLSLEAFQRSVSDLQRLYEAHPVAIAHDHHPDYLSTRWARESAGPIPLVEVQHHHAHLASCLADNAHPGPALGVTWDGAGLGDDGTIWGGEFLLGDAGEVRRVAHLRAFRLPGGDTAAREPRRLALSLLWSLRGPEAFALRSLAPLESLGELSVSLIGQMLDRGLNAPMTTSAGRLLDGIASLCGLAQVSTFEGHAAMALEREAWRHTDPEAAGAYPLPLRRAMQPWVLDWEPLVEALLEDLERCIPPAHAAARALNALVEGIVEVARHAGAATVALTGGCFQNRWLLKGAERRLSKEGFVVLRHRRIPPNDGGIAAGQVMVAAARLVRQSGGNGVSRNPR